MNSTIRNTDSLNSECEFKGCQYYTIPELLSSFPKNDISNVTKECFYNNDFKLLHINSRSISKNFDSLETLLQSLVNFPFSVIGISETWLHENSPDIYNIPNYEMLHVNRKEGRGGGVALYVFNKLEFKIRKDIHVQGIEDVFIEIKNESGKNVIVGTLYRPPSNNLNIFLENLDETLEKISRENKSIYLLGDFNIDLTKSGNISFTSPVNMINSTDQNSNSNCKFLNILYSHAFFPCIDKPTRITSSSSTLIDNIFTNTFDKDNYSGILYYDVSDHLPIFLISSQSLKKDNVTKHIVQRYRKESTETITALNDDLANEQWLDVYEEKDVNRAYEKFITKLKQYYEKNVPLIQIKPCKKSAKNPWITQGILNSIKTRNKLYKSYICKPSPQSHDIYKQYRNKLTKTIRKSKIAYYSQELQRAEGDTNSTWKVLNKIMNKVKPHNKIDHVHINDKEVKDPSDIANAFNSFFSSIGPDLASKIRCNNLHFSKFLSRRLTKTIFFDITTQSEIVNIVKSLQPKTSTGYDGLSMKLLKQIIQSIAQPLEYIFNISLSCGICPSLLKIAKVVPIYKKDDKTQVTNYRPISLLPSISKVLEKIVYKRLISFLTVNNILNQSQFGFRKNCSTDFAIIELIDKVTKQLSQKEHVIAVFMDLSKAFDTIDHNILLYKLDHYGIRGPALSWFKSYLSDRQQFVHINGYDSSMSNIHCGVPQGSILGPLLFLIYINDILNSSSILKFTLFADDTTVLASHKNRDSLIHILNSELTKISSWFKCNKLSLNIGKTNFMHFQTTHTNINPQSNYDIKIDGLPLEKKDYTKFLGVTIDRHLSWNYHIANTSSHLAKGIGILYRVKHILPQKHLLMLYNTLLLPYITYCNLIWGNCGTSKLNSIFLLQKRL